MLFQILGSTGIGLVWGWLISNLEGRAIRRLRTIFTIFGATLAFCLVVFGYISWAGVASFLGATVLAFLFHSALNIELRAQRRQANHQI